MNLNNLTFYHSKIKLFISLLFLAPFNVLGLMLIHHGWLINDVGLIIFATLFTFLFSSFFISNLLKLIRGNPYVIITDDYIQIDPYTRSEATIYLKDITGLFINQFQLNKVVVIHLQHEYEYLDKLSLHNKIRLLPNKIFALPLYTISVTATQKTDRLPLLTAVEIINEERLEHDVPIVDSVFDQLTNSENAKEVLTKQHDVKKVDRTIHLHYFKKAYLASFIIFLISFILFYLLILQDNFYLVYIIISFILYPFTRAITDLLYGFKFKDFVENNLGPTLAFERLKDFIDFGIFHISIFLAPFSILFLLFRSFFRRNR